MASTADTIEARVRLRASQAHEIELKLGGAPSAPAFQSSAYQSDAFQSGGMDIFRNVTLLGPARPA